MNSTVTKTTGRLVAIVLLFASIDLGPSIAHAESDCPTGGYPAHSKLSDLVRASDLVVRATVLEAKQGSAIVEVTDMTMKGTVSPALRSKLRVVWTRGQSHVQELRTVDSDYLLFLKKRGSYFEATDEGRSFFEIDRANRKSEPDSKRMPAIAYVDPIDLNCLAETKVFEMSFVNRLPSLCGNCSMPGVFLEDLKLEVLKISKGGK